jgi:cysteine desulfurase family protein (TIGR01976 family)
MTEPMSETKDPKRAASLRPEAVRPLFPALERPVGGLVPVFLDGPGGTQVCAPAIEAMLVYQASGSANTGGAFASSRRTDRTIEAARRAGADLVGARDTQEIVLGPNMTTLTFRVAHAMARRLGPGDEVVVTRMDHDANIAPWRMLERQGVLVRQVQMRPQDCTLDMDSLEAALGPRTRLLAVSLASNAVGTIHPVREIVERARQAGAWTYVDAVHYAPHALIDVETLGCDFLACSAYKIFGPYLGMLWGRRERLAELEPDKVRPAPKEGPERWEQGTKDHASLAGFAASVDYLAELGALAEEPEPLSRQAVSRPHEPLAMAAAGLLQAMHLPAPDHAAQELSGPPATDGPRRSRLRRSFQALRLHELRLARHLIEALSEVPGLRIYGVTDLERLEERVPTVSFTMAGRAASEVADELARQGIYCWAGDFYAQDLVEALDLAGAGGLVRVGAVHYNTHAEIERLAAALADLAGG